ncbi:MAG: hypothetical protein ACPGUV_07570, partial [Polyangiales bacterium]
MAPSSLRADSAARPAPAGEDRLWGGIVAAALLLALGCQGNNQEALGLEDEGGEISLQSLRTSLDLGEDGAGLFGIDVLVTDPAGQPITCQGSIELSVEFSHEGPDGPFEMADSAQFIDACANMSHGELSLVVDNSGSEDGYLPMLQQAAKEATRALTGAGGRASLVRVSTESSMRHALSGDAAALDGAIDELFIRRGWTALYDGIRMGNESFGAVGDAAAIDPMAYCSEASKRGILAFTDGRENNSMGQELISDAYLGDGIDTALTDLYGLAVGGVQTPIYPIGMGDGVDAAAMADLADKTGGRYLSVSDPSELPAVFQMVSNYFGQSMRVCGQLPARFCGEGWARIHYRWTDGSLQVSGSQVMPTQMPCPAPPQGKVVTMLHAMTDPGLPRESAKQLAAQALRWVTGMESPKVLIILDDFHKGEHAGDTDALVQMLLESGFFMTYLNEPERGLHPIMLENFDAVWFANPGYPIDDQASRDTLMDFIAKGGGVVMQGDDISWSFGRNFDMAPLTQVEHIDNGTRYCGVRIDNRRGREYSVTLRSESHPVIAGLEGMSFTYGDD